MSQYWIVKYKCHIFLIDMLVTKKRLLASDAKCHQPLMIINTWKTIQALLMSLHMVIMLGVARQSHFFPLPCHI